LLLEFGSVVVDETEATSMIVAPDAVEGSTLTTSGKLAVALTARLAIVQVAVTHVQPAGAASDTNVVLAGKTSVNVRFAAAAGPLFVTTCVYAMLFPARTAAGAPTLVTAKSAWPAVETPVVIHVALSAKFVSYVVVLTEAAPVITVPAATPLFTFTWICRLAAGAPFAKLAMVHEMFPVPFTAGVVQLHPAGGVIDWNVVFAGTASVNTDVAASLGPAFVIVCV
jgi:hypothetical protein